MMLIGLDRAGEYYPVKMTDLGWDGSRLAYRTRYQWLDHSVVTNFRPTRSQSDWGLEAHRMAFENKVLRTGFGLTVEISVDG